MYWYQLKSYISNEECLVNIKVSYTVLNKLSAGQNGQSKEYTTHRMALSKVE